MGLEAAEQAFLDRTLIELDGNRETSRGLGLPTPTLGRSSRWGPVGRAPARGPKRARACPLLIAYPGRAWERSRRPVPMMNIINGRVAHGGQTTWTWQEFMNRAVSGAPPPFFGGVCATARGGVFHCA